MKNDFFSILNPASVEPCDHDDISTVNERESQTVVSESHDNVDVIHAVERESPTVVHDILQQDSTTANIEPTGNKRTSKSPAYLHDYYCSMTETDVPYPLASYVSMEKLSEGYVAYICSISLHPEPTSFTQAKKFDAWLQGMNEELIALENTHT